MRRMMKRFATWLEKYHRKHHTPGQALQHRHPGTAVAGAALESQLALIAVGVLQWHSCYAGSDKQGIDATLSGQQRNLCYGHIHTSQYCCSADCSLPMKACNRVIYV